VQRARAQQPGQRFLSLAVAPPHLQQPGREAERYRYEAQLLAAGADAVIPSTDRVAEHLPLAPRGSRLR
jgi:HAD superfamily phosphatase